MNEKSSFVLYYLTVLVYAKTIIHVMSVACGEHLTHRFAAR